MPRTIKGMFNTASGPSVPGVAVGPIVHTSNNSGGSGGGGASTIAYPAGHVTLIGSGGGGNGLYYPDPINPNLPTPLPMVPPLPVYTSMPMQSFPHQESEEQKFKRRVARAEIVAKVEAYIENYLKYRTNGDLDNEMELANLMQTRAILLARKLKGEASEL